ncbi:MAG: CPBP family intramembrane metalloprotease [Chloroflexi bacterium]|nr:CPBP family intramembrane metalloprotease [Chloroflexota bacterium]
MIVPTCLIAALRYLRNMDQRPQNQPEIISPTDRFLELAKSGVNRWWVWILGVVLIIVIWQGIGSVPILAACEFVKSAQLVDFTCEDAMIVGVSSLPSFVLGAYAFVIAMFGIWAVVRVLHKKPFTNVVTARQSFDINRVLFAMLVGFLVLAAPFLLAVTIGSDEISFQSPNAWEYVTFFMFAVVLIPFQAGFEEVLFRGYLMQGFALLTRNRVLLVLITASIFTLPHLPNPEPWEYGVVPYVARIMTLGGFFALLTLLDGGIELATGIHIVNNLIYTLLATTSVSAIQSPALFLIEVDEYRLFPDIIGLWVMLGIMVAILNWNFKWFRYSQLASFLNRQRD